MSTGHPYREPHWLYDKAERQKRRALTLADYERDYRREAGLPEGPLDLPEWASLQCALKTFELFMDRVFWGGGTSEMTGILDATKLATYDPRPPMPRDPLVEHFFDEAMAWFEDVRFLPEHRGTSPLEDLVRRQGRDEELTWDAYLNGSEIVFREEPPKLSPESILAVREAFYDAVQRDGFVRGTGDVESDQRRTTGT